MSQLPREPASDEAPARSLRRAVSDTEKASRRGEILSAAKRNARREGQPRHDDHRHSQAAGLSCGSIYWYYESRETLLRDLMTLEATALRSFVDNAQLLPNGLLPRMGSGLGEAPSGTG